MIMDMQYMKDLLGEKLEALPPYEIDACINQFRHRLRKVIKVAGKHILNNFSRIAVLGKIRGAKQGEVGGSQPPLNFGGGGVEHLSTPLILRGFFSRGDEL